MQAINIIYNRIQQFKDKTSLYWNNKSYSYCDFIHLVSFWKKILVEKGIKKGQICAFYGEYSPNICALIFALLLNENILVPFTSAIEKEIEAFSAIAGIDWLFRFDERDEWTLGKIEKYHGKNELIENFYERDVPGLIVFTSGSTGKPKGILQDCERVMKKFIEPRESWRTVLFLMMDHFGGFNTLLSSFAYGGTAVCLPDRKPDTVCKIIDESKATLLPTTPTFLNLLIASNAYKNHDLSSIKLITYGTEVMPQSILQKVKEIFPNCQIKQTYGLSELGVLRSKSESDDSLWVKLGGKGFETKIVDNVLWIRSEANMVGYLNAPNPFDEDGWMCTDDHVEVKGGYIRILGRKSDVINVGGQKIFPAEVESVLLEDSNVKEVSVFGMPHSITGNIVAARITLNQPESQFVLSERLRKHCLLKMAKYKMPVKFIIVENGQFNTRFKKIRK